jgi:hypothetical protein
MAKTNYEIDMSGLANCSGIIAVLKKVIEEWHLDVVQD